MSAGVSLLVGVGVGSRGCGGLFLWWSSRRVWGVDGEAGAGGHAGPGVVFVCLAGSSFLVDEATEGEFGVGELVWRRPARRERSARDSTRDG